MGGATIPGDLNLVGGSAVAREFPRRNFYAIAGLKSLQRLPGFLICAVYNFVQVAAVIQHKVPHVCVHFCRRIVFYTFRYIVCCPM